MTTARWTITATFAMSTEEKTTPTWDGTATPSPSLTTVDEDAPPSVRRWWKHPYITPAVHAVTWVGGIVTLLVPGLNVVTVVLLGIEGVNLFFDVRNAYKWSSRK